MAKTTYNMQIDRRAWHSLMCRALDVPERYGSQTAVARVLAQRMGHPISGAYYGGIVRGEEPNPVHAVLRFSVAAGLRVIVDDEGMRFELASQSEAA